VRRGWRRHPDMSELLVDLRIIKYEGYGSNGSLPNKQEALNSNPSTAKNFKKGKI
jgi:hypothetical protein